MAYNYLEAVTEDTIEIIKEFGIDSLIEESGASDLSDLSQYLNDKFWIEDSITGNASGSYSCNRYRAEEALAHNYLLIQEVACEFGMNLSNTDPESLDVSIRCYLLGTAIDEALQELNIDDDYIESIAC